ncbi:MAG: hypothetical protein V1827_00145 [Candidatus Micrarchaeota archaeon]
MRAAEQAEFVEFGPKGANQGVREGDLKALYNHTFSNPDERSPWARIESEIAIHSAVGAPELARLGYRWRLHALAAVKEGRVVGFSFFKSIQVDLANFAIALMYTGAADHAYSKMEYGIDKSFRSLGLASTFGVLAHAIALEDAEMAGCTTVAGMISEAELIGQGKTLEEIRFTRTRLDIHAKNGKLPLMLEVGGKWMAPIIQPALRSDSNPLILHMLFKPLSFKVDAASGIGEISLEMASKLVHTYISMFRSDGYPAETLEAPKNEMLRRIQAARRAVLMQPSAVPDIVRLAESDPMLMTQIERDHGDPKNHGERIAKALGGDRAIGPGHPP